jgi:hypothetical protein
MPASDLERSNNAHDTEAAVALYERAENALSCCHDLALNQGELRSRLLQVALDHGMLLQSFSFTQHVKKGSTEQFRVGCAWKGQDPINAKQAIQT